MTKMTLKALHTLVADDAFAATFQSVSQYRGALLRAFDYLTAHPTHPCLIAPAQPTQHEGRDKTNSTES